MSNLLAAVCCGQLRVLEERVARRREINVDYREVLDHLAARGVLRPVERLAQPE